MRKGEVIHQKTSNFVYNPRHGLKYPQAARKFCLDLFASIQDPESHVFKIDSAFASIYQARLMKSTVSKYVVSIEFLALLFCQAFIQLDSSHL